MIYRLIADMEKNNLDGFFISGIYNVRYMSGYTSDDAYLLITKDKKYFITDPRYTEQALEECSDFEIINWRKDGKPLADTVAKLAKENQIKRLGFEAVQVNYLTYSAIEKAVDTELVPMSNIIEAYRAIKTKEEATKIKTACEISCRAFEKILKDIKVGATEKEIGAKLAYYMVMEGSDAKPYGEIVISGKRTSLLHGIPSDKKIEEGDFVLMDFGCAYEGYLSDMTRTVVVGKADAEQRTVYELEQRMVQDCLDIMKAGVTSQEIYEASIQAIKDTKYMPYHYNGIGHGIGMFVHEMPSCGKNSYDVIEENVITTIEPGIYIPNWGGVRIEDQVLITKTGYENFITATKELIEL